MSLPLGIIILFLKRQIDSCKVVKSDLRFLQSIRFKFQLIKCEILSLSHCDEVQAMSISVKKRK